MSSNAKRAMFWLVLAAIGLLMYCFSILEYGIFALESRSMLTQVLVFGAFVHIYTHYKDHEDV